MYATLGRLIRARRLSRGLSQSQLATVVGVTKMAISKYESGAIAPAIDQLMRLAAACDIPLSMYLSPLDDIEAHPRRVRTWRRRNVE